MVNVALSPCTLGNSRGVFTAFLNFPERRENSQEQKLFVKRGSHEVLTPSSRRPRLVQCIATEFELCSTAFLWRSGWHFMAFARRFQCACATLLVYVSTAFPWRSGTALTACRQSRYDVSIICLFALSAVPAYTCTQIENQFVV